MATYQQIKDRHDAGWRIQAVATACADVARKICEEAAPSASRKAFAQEVLQGGAGQGKASQATLAKARSILYFVLMYWGSENGDPTRKYTDAQLGNLTSDECYEAVNKYVDTIYGAS